MLRVDGLFDIGPATPGHRPGAAADARSGGALAGNPHASAPLAVRMRPRTLDELVGQEHLLSAGSPLRRLVEGDQPMSLLLWGPPGTGKTTIASIVSLQTNRRFVEVSAVAFDDCDFGYPALRLEAFRGAQRQLGGKDEIALRR